MAISIGGVSSSFSTRQISTAQKALGKNLDRLGSGKRIGTAADDAAGLAIAKKLQSALGSATQASRNIDYGVSQADIADGALARQHDLVRRMRSLAMQSASGSLNSTDRASIQGEFSQLRSEVGRIADTTEFNDKPLLQVGSTDVQVGSGSGADNRISVASPDSGTAALGLDGVDLSSAAGAQAALDSFDTAIESISTSRADIGATRNRFVGALKENSATIENIAAAASRIEDADVGQESSQLVLNKTRQDISARLSKFESGISAGLLLDLIV